MARTDTKSLGHALLPQVNTSEKRRLFVFHEFEIFQFILYRVYVDLFFRHSGQLDIKKKYYSWDVMF